MMHIIINIKIKLNINKENILKTKKSRQLRSVVKKNKPNIKLFVLNIRREAIGHISLLYSHPYIHVTRSIIYYATISLGFRLEGTSIRRIWPISGKLLETNTSISSTGTLFVLRFAVKKNIFGEDKCPKN